MRERLFGCAVWEAQERWGGEIGYSNCRDRRKLGARREGSSGYSIGQWGRCSGLRSGRLGLEDGGIVDVAAVVEFGLGAEEELAVAAIEVGIAALEPTGAAAVVEVEAVGVPVLAIVTAAAAAL